MDIRKIRKLSELMEETGLYELEIKEGDVSLRLSRHSTSLAEMSHNRPIPVSHHQQHAAHPAPTAPIPTHTHESKPAEATISGHKIRSPMVGTMYSSPSPEAPPFVTIGQSVKVGDTLCIIEAMKMFNEIESDRAGKIVDILVSNGDPIEYDQVLFIIE